ncbi:MAG: hypothetical protein WCJ84_05490 [Candidatus Peregrinibacteria bacterium]
MHFELKSRNSPLECSKVDTRDDLLKLARNTAGALGIHIPSCHTFATETRIYNVSTCGNRVLDDLRRWERETNAKGDVVVSTTPHASLVE